MKKPTPRVKIKTPPKKPYSFYPTDENTELMQEYKARGFVISEVINYAIAKLGKELFK